MHFPDHELCKSVHPLDDSQGSSSSSTSRVPLVSWVVAVFLPTICLISGLSPCFLEGSCGPSSAGSEVVLALTGILCFLAF